MGKRRATVEQCDNPECGYEQIVERGEPAQGYHLGKGQYDLDWGGGLLKPIYAHSLDCIKPAILAQQDER